MSDRFTGSIKLAAEREDFWAVAHWRAARAAEEVYFAQYAREIAAMQESGQIEPLERGERNG